MLLTIGYQYWKIQVQSMNDDVYYRLTHTTIEIHLSWTCTRILWQLVIACFVVDPRHAMVQPSTASHICSVHFSKTCWGLSYPGHSRWFEQNHFMATEYHCVEQWLMYMVWTLSTVISVCLLEYYTNVVLWARSRVQSRSFAKSALFMMCINATIPMPRLNVLFLGN